MCATTASIAPAQSIPTWTPNETAGATPPAPVSATLRKAQKAIRSAWQFIAFIGALAVVAGTVAELGNISFLLTYLDWYTAVEGMIFLTLAYFIRGGSLVALGIAIALYALDSVALFVTGHFAAIRILILIYLVRALGSANILRQHRKRSAQQAAGDQSRAA